MTAPILVTGGGGMLATALGDVFGDIADLVTRADLDITDESAVQRAVVGRVAVINTAAYTAVDYAEANDDAARDVNVHGAMNVASACARTGVRLVHVSTDYVFDGLATSPYSENAITDPRTAYGQSKLEGELAVRSAHRDGTTVVRTAWLYGAGGPSFVATMLAKARAGEPVSVVTDQFGQPTWTRDLAERIRLLLDVTPGTFHATNSGACSWWDLAVAIYEEVGAPTTLVGQTTSDAFVRPAQRPAYSVLSDGAAQSAGLPAMPPWRDAIGKALRADFSL
jgi:dTDP-4-dehydrorhamnose reductase